MDPTVLVALLGVGVLVCVLVASRRQIAIMAHASAAEGEALKAPQTVAEEDLTRYSEDLSRIDRIVGEVEHDPLRSEHHARAVHAKAEATKALKTARVVDDLLGVSEALESGRHEIACVDALVVGDPVPERRPPCFFNPSHGPSCGEVSWTDRAGRVHVLPSCAADVERVRRGADPYVRTVPGPDGRVPYWEGGQEYRAWASGWFARWADLDLMADASVLLGLARGRRSDAA